MSARGECTPEDLIFDDITPAKPHSLGILTPPSLRVQNLPSGTRPAVRPPLHEGWTDDEDVTPPTQRPAATTRAPLPGEGPGEDTGDT